MMMSKDCRSLEFQSRPTRGVAEKFSRIFSAIIYLFRLLSNIYLSGHAFNPIFRTLAQSEVAPKLIYHFILCRGSIIFMEFTRSLETNWSQINTISAKINHEHIAF